MTCCLKGQKEVMLEIMLYGVLVAKTGPLPFAQKTSRVAGGQRSALLKHIVNVSISETNG